MGAPTTRAEGGWWWNFTLCKIYRDVPPKWVDFTQKIVNMGPILTPPKKSRNMCQICKKNRCNYVFKLDNLNAYKFALKMLFLPGVPALKNTRASGGFAPWISTRGTPPGPLSGPLDPTPQERALRFFALCASQEIQTAGGIGCLFDPGLRGV